MFGRLSLSPRVIRGSTRRIVYAHAIPQSSEIADTATITNIMLPTQAWTANLKGVCQCAEAASSGPPAQSPLLMFSQAERLCDSAVGVSEGRTYIAKNLTAASHSRVYVRDKRRLP